MDFGSLLAPGMQPSQQAQSQWDGWLQDPANRAAMMTFGLNMLAGGWGSGMQQFAHAAGQGAEAAAGVQQTQLVLDEKAKDNARADAAFAQRASEGEKDRQSREKIAGMYATQRLESSKIRAGATGPGGGLTLTRQERQFWDRTYLETKKALAYSGLDEDAVEAAAQNSADNALAARQERFGGGKTSPNSAPAGGQGGTPTSSAPPGKTSGNPIPGAGPAGAASFQQNPKPGPVRVNSVEEARKLAPGTRFIGPDGKTRIR